MPQEKTFRIEQSDVRSGLSIFVQQYNDRSSLGKPIVSLNKDAVLALGRAMETTIDLFKYTALSEITKDLLKDFRYGFFQQGADEAEFIGQRQ